MKKNNVYYIVTFIIILILLLTLFFEKGIASRITTTITLITAIIGSVSLFIQYKRDKDVNQSTFLIEYAKFFYNLTDVENTLFFLEEYRLGNKNITAKISYRGIVNYLFWCEELASLVQKDVFDIETIDNLFSYNFFLIVNNKFIQDSELIPQAEFYKGIFYLHKKWTEYKKGTKQPIINDEENLNKIDIYEKYVKKGDNYNKKDF